MISFIHGGGPGMASYRYRVQIPAVRLNAQINQYPADILIFAKPQPDEVEFARRAQSEGCKVVVDFCDDHFEQPHYQQMMEMADRVVCSTPVLAERIPRPVYIIPDTYELDELEPHCAGSRLLWFGHKINGYSIDPFLDLPDLRIVSNRPGAIPWSVDTVEFELQCADIVLMPATASYKSPNRTLEAIRSGCFVVAEPHPAINDFPIWIGDIREGIEWAKQNPSAANEMTREAQAFIRTEYSPEIQASAWRTALTGLI
jgi:hypothetical protein